MIEPGSISTGTIRLVDLLPSCEKVLRLLAPEQARKLECRFEAAFEILAKNPLSDWDLTDHEWNELESLFLELLDILGSLAPEGYYFGTHPGDGADYGFWPI